LLLIGGRLSTLDPMLLLARAVDLIDAFTVIDPVLGGRAAAKRAFDARTLQMRAYARSYRILFPRGLLRIIFFGNATFMAMLGVRSAPSAEQRRAMLRLNREDPERDIHCLVMVDEAGTSKYCHNCKLQLEQLVPWSRKYCVHCQMFVNRDTSAAMNIFAKGVHALTYQGEGHPSLRRNFHLQA